jgi:NAD(P)H-nitrite reductase large subunit
MCSPQGDFSGGDGCEDIVLRDATRGIYKRVIVKDDKILGAVLYGDTADGNWYFDLLKKGEDISDIRDALIFGQAFASGGGATANPIDAVAALPDDAEICGCNGVSKGKVMACIAGGAHTLDAVRSTCKASASCGSCTGLVENLLQFALGDEFAGERDAKPMCKCTSFTHEDVRAAILEKSLKEIPAVMQALSWSTPDGCSSCRPALNYYLLCAWPAEHKEDPQSRFVNERMHANIQKDGTYSVVPRMWGGVTTPNELRAIADAADKYGARMVKVTGGQRLDLFGIKKGGLALHMGRPERRRDGLRPCLWQGAAHGEDLRRLRMVPLRHAGFDRAWHPPRTDDVGKLDAAQVQDRGVRLPAQLRRGDNQGLSGLSASIAAMSFWSAAMAASTCAARTCCARSPPRRRRSNIAAPSSSSTARRRAISIAPRRGSSASASIM